jgi:hypothetical protein
LKRIFTATDPDSYRERLRLILEFGIWNLKYWNFINVHKQLKYHTS